MLKSKSYKEESKKQRANLSKIIQSKHNMGAPKGSKNALGNKGGGRKLNNNFECKKCGIYLTFKQQIMDIKTKSIEELKAMGYDQIALGEQTKYNLQVINEEIKLRSQEPTKDPEVKLEEKL